MNFSLLRIMWNDWPALACWVALPVVWIIHWGFPYLQRGAVPLPLALPAGVSVALLAVLFWRIKRVADLFAHGVAVSGTITDLRIARDRGRLEFEFEAGGTRLRSWMPVHKTRSLLSLARGDRVEVLHDRCRPRRAIVRTLFAR
ncbi:hypothetical protein [Methyloversatilis sp.]|uniref:hypothetical protein n=1 Tax=Methyloversatilis sp. TaxID=2569862 RepID=UPI0035B3E966